MPERNAPAYRALQSDLSGPLAGWVANDAIVAPAWKCR